MKIFVDKELFQWEKNRKVLIEPDPKTEAPPVFAQFYNSGMSESLENPVVNNTVRIPNQILEQDKPIMVVICSGTYDDAHVISRREFKVIKRPKIGNFSDYDEPESPDIPGGDEPIDKEIIYDGGEEI